MHKVLFDLSNIFKSAIRTTLAPALAAMALAGTASPALAETTASTKLVRCGAQDCLQVSGYRTNPGLIVRLNGNDVEVEGKHGWRVELPVETIRQWSAPNARAIVVALRDPLSEQQDIVVADLPIGLLGDVTALASLEVRAP